MVLTFPDGTRYEGPFVNGQKHGTGSFIEVDGTVKKGKWAYNKFQNWIDIEEEDIDGEEGEEEAEEEDVEGEEE